MKVVVIGSNSFSGAHFVDYLLKNTDYEVIGISRSPEKSDLYLAYKNNDKDKLSKFRFYKFDLNKDMDKILKCIDENRAEYVVNFASQSMVGQSWDNPAHWYRTNIMSTVELTNNLKDKKFLKKYVHISTPEVYGTCEGTVKEDYRYKPSTPYAASRSAADTFIQLLVKNFGFPAVFTRAANVYGSGQQLFKIIPRSIIYIKKKKKIPLHGGGHAERSFIHIKDVCAATLDVMEQAKTGEIYHLSTPKMISIRDLVSTICNRMGVTFDDAVETVETRRGLDMAYILDSSKAKTDFGWEPKISIDEGLKEVITWVENNWPVLSNEALEYVHKE